MNLHAEIEKTFPRIEKFLLPKELEDFVNMPVGDLYIFHYGLTMWVRNVILNENRNLYWSFLDNHVECIDTMTETVLRLFHFHVLNKYKKAYQEKRKGGNSLIWCEKRQVYVYRTDPLPPQYVVIK